MVSWQVSYESVGKAVVVRCASVRAAVIVGWAMNCASARTSVIVVK